MDLHGTILYNKHCSKVIEFQINSKTKQCSIKIHAIKMTTLYIHAKSYEDPSNLHEYDAGVEGTYKISLSEKIPKEGLANAALDIFHIRTPVKRIDDFEFTVRQTAESGSPEILPSDDYPIYRFANEKSSVEKIS